MATRSTLMTKNHKQVAVYWANSVEDGYGGRTFDAPVEIDCRWEQKQELFIDASGRESVSKAVVFVGQDIAPGEYLFLGALDDLPSAPTPMDADVTAYEIRGFSKIPNIRATDYERKAWL